MKKSFYLILASALLMLAGSCKKNDDLTITLKQQGFLTVKMVDSNGAPIPNAKVSVRMGREQYSVYYDSKKSNEAGIVEFGELLSGVYFVEASDIEVNGKAYSVFKMVQVTVGMNSVLELNPETYVGTAKINVFLQDSYNTIGIVPEVNVALIPRKKMQDMEEITHAALVGIANMTAKADVRGTVVFQNVPANVSYFVYVYFDENHSNINDLSSNNDIVVGKDEESKKSVTVRRNDIYDVNGSVALTFTPDYYNPKNVANMEVFLIPESKKYELRDVAHSKIVAKAVCSGKTDSNGKVTFAKVRVNNYAIYTYFSDSKRGWVSESVYVREDEVAYSNIYSNYYSWMR